VDDEEHSVSLGSARQSAASPASTATAVQTTVVEASSSAESEEQPLVARHRNVFGKSQRFEARKVRRLIRHIDPWGVLKISLVFHFSMWVISVVASIIVWNTADNVGLIDKIENLLDKVQIQVDINADYYLRQFGLFGLLGVFAATGLTVVACVIYNLINDVVGGIWITVIEEETARPVSGSPEPE
jgi:hypothetical protein